MTKAHFAIVVALLGTMLCQSAQPQVETLQWPRFRGPNGLGVSSTEGIPTQWSAIQNIVWKTELPGAGASSPIVVGERVFVTCYSGYGEPGKRQRDLSQLKRHVLCLSLDDGAVQWQKDVPASLPEPRRVGEHGYATSTPISDGERLYVFLGKSGVFAFDLAGEQLWQADVGSGTHKWGSATSPVLYQKLLIVNASVESGALIALDRDTGQEAWRCEGIRQSWNTPALVPLPGGKTELVVGVEGSLLGIDPDSSEKRWSCSGYRSYMCPSPIWHGDVVYALWGRRTLAVRPGGEGDVTRTRQAWNFWRNNAGSAVSSPVYHEGHLYFAHAYDGVVYCMDGETGAIVYREPLSPKPGKIYASPVLAEGKLHYVSRTDGAFVVAAKPELEILAHNDLGDDSVFDASPAVAGSRLLLRSNRCLYCIGH